VYDNPELPCERCKDRGVACGAKIWGEKTELDLQDGPSTELLARKSVLFLTRPSRRPDDEMITPHDDLYLQYFLIERQGASFYYFLQLQNETVSLSIIPRSRISLLLSSETLRCAALAVASSHIASENSTQYFYQYLDRCYRRMRKAISGPISVDLAYACFMLAKVDSENANPVHLIGLQKIIAHLDLEPGGLIEWESRWLQGLLIEGLWCLRDRLVSLTMDVNLTKTQVQKVCDLLRSTISWRPSLSRSAQFLKTVYFYYSTYVLLLLSGVVDDRSTGTTTELSIFTGELQHLTTRLSDRLLQNRLFLTVLQDFRSQNLPECECYYDWTHRYHACPRDPLHYSIYVQIPPLQCYFGSKLIYRMLENGDRESTDIIEWACDLYHLASLMGPMNRSHSMEIWDIVEVGMLFLTGMVMTKSRHPEGAFTLCIFSLMR
jgi:hypothetical protein